MPLLVSLGGTNSGGELPARDSLGIISAWASAQGVERIRTRQGGKCVFFLSKAKAESIILTKAAFTIFSREKALGTGRRQRSRDKGAAGLPASSRTGDSWLVISADLRGAPVAREARPHFSLLRPLPSEEPSGFLLALPDSRPETH